MTLPPTAPPDVRTNAELVAALDALMIQGGAAEMRRAILAEPGGGKLAHAAAAERGLQRWVADLTERAERWDRGERS